MKTTYYLLIALLSITATSVIASQLATPTPLDSNAASVSPTNPSESLQAEGSQEDQLSLDSLFFTDGQGLTSNLSIGSAITTNTIICSTRTCECFDCQFGVGCVPAPPQPWCTPI